MKTRRLLHLFFCAVATSSIVAGMFWIDAQRARSEKQNLALHWARQIAAQAEGMTLSARESHKKDPIEWAVGFLSQGVEPRVILINKVVREEPSEKAETFKYDGVSNVFDYTKIFMPEENAGIRVQLRLNYSGFLGSHSRMDNDLNLVVTAAMIGLILFFLTGKYFGVTTAGKIKEQVASWARESKNILAQLGVHVREVLRQAASLASAANKSHQTIGALREKIHQGINGVHDARMQLQHCEQGLTQADVVAFSAAMEASQLGPNAKHVADVLRELHRKIQNVKKALKGSADALQKIEINIEPWATDADVAYHAFDDLTLASEQMQGHIKKSTEAMLSQAKMIKALNEEIGAIQIPGASAPTASSTQPQKRVAKLQKLLPEHESLDATAPTPAPKRRTSKRSAA